MHRLFARPPSVVRILLGVAALAILAMLGVAGFVASGDRAYAKELDRVDQGPIRTAADLQPQAEEIQAMGRSSRAAECDLRVAGVTSGLALQIAGRSAPLQFDIDRTKREAEDLDRIQPPARWSTFHDEIRRRTALRAEFLAEQRAATLRAKELLATTPITTDLAVIQLLTEDPTYARHAGAVKQVVQSGTLTTETTALPWASSLVAGKSLDPFTRTGVVRQYAISLDPTSAEPGATAASRESLLAMKRAQCEGTAPTPA